MIPEITVPCATIGPAVYLYPKPESATFVSQMTCPVIASRATICAKGVVPRILSS